MLHPTLRSTPGIPASSGGAVGGPSQSNLLREHLWGQGQGQGSVLFNFLLGMTAGELQQLRRKPPPACQRASPPQLCTRFLPSSFPTPTTHAHMLYAQEVGWEKSSSPSVGRKGWERDFFLGVNGRGQSKERQMIHRASLCPFYCLLLGLVTQGEIGSPLIIGALEERVTD